MGFYQREDQPIIHGIFKVCTQEADDVRARILKSFLERRHARAAVAQAASSVQVR